MERYVRTRTTPQRVAMRSRIVLLLGDGYTARAVARRLVISRHTVDLWRHRYLQGGCDALMHDKPGRGRPIKNARSAAADGTHPGQPLVSQRAD